MFFLQRCLGLELAFQASSASFPALSSSVSCLHFRPSLAHLGLELAFQATACSNPVQCLAFSSVLPRMPVALPRDMKESLAALKPACPNWGSEAGCKKGRKCRFSHDIPPDRDADPFTVPYMDTRVAEDGTLKMTVRLPIAQALAQFFKEHRVTPTLRNGKCWTTDTGEKVITYQFQNTHPFSPECKLGGPSGEGIRI